MFGYTRISATYQEDTPLIQLLYYLGESFPNRAEIEESIYSHAAIFQLDDILSEAASCKFILVLEKKLL